MTTYSQRTDPWQSLKINGTSSSMHDYGCTITSLTMLFDRGGEGKGNPGDMLHQLEGWGAFIQDLVWWTKVPHFQQRIYCTDVIAPVEEIKNHARSGQVLLNVHFGSGNPYKPNHWVLLLDDQWNIADPWTGDAVNLVGRYGTPEKAILGAAYFDLPMKPEIRIPEDLPWIEVTVEIARLRDEANTTSKIMKLLYRGNRLQYDGEKDGFYHIWNGGYVRKDLVKQI